MTGEIPLRPLATAQLLVSGAWPQVVAPLFGKVRVALRRPQSAGAPCDNGRRPSPAPGGFGARCLGGGRRPATGVSSRRGDGWARPRRNSNEPSDNHPTRATPTGAVWRTTLCFPAPSLFASLYGEGKPNQGTTAPFGSGRDNRSMQPPATRALASRPRPAAARGCPRPGPGGALSRDAVMDRAMVHASWGSVVLDVWARTAAWTGRLGDGSLDACAAESRRVSRDRGPEARRPSVSAGARGPRLRR